jgi:hypothetical protein
MHETHWKRLKGFSWNSILGKSTARSLATSIFIYSLLNQQPFHVKINTRFGTHAPRTGAVPLTVDYSVTIIHADSTARLSSPHFVSVKGAIMIMLSVRKFSKNLAATSKFEVPEWWHKISSTCCPTNIRRLPTQPSLCRRRARDLCTLIYPSWYVEC